MSAGDARGPEDSDPIALVRRGHFPLPDSGKGKKAALLLLLVLMFQISACAQDAHRKLDQEKIERHQQEQMKRMG